jgi:hypothetical protein
MGVWRHEGVVRGLLGRAPGQDLQLLDPRPSVRVRAVYGRAIATTTTHVLHEWRKAGELHARWDEKWQVTPVSPHDWHGEELY